MNSKPNIILIITDQQRADTLGLYGSKLGATPEIDRIGEEGVCFERGYCNNPLCMPSRASIMTGRYPSATGVRTNGCYVRPDQPLLTNILVENGYKTAAFGKIHFHPWDKKFPEYVNESDSKYRNNNNNRNDNNSGNADDMCIHVPYNPENEFWYSSDQPLDRPYLGFQTVAAATGHSDVGKGLHARQLRKIFPDLDRLTGPRNAVDYPDELLRYAHKIQTYKTRIPVEHYITNWVADRVVEYIEKTDEPFFVWCGFPDPHHPFKAPGKYYDLYNPSDMPEPVKREGELDDKPPHFKNFLSGKYRNIDTDGFLLGSDPYLNRDRVAKMQDDADQLGLRLRTLVTESWKMTCYEGQSYGELYNLKNDPNEFENLWFNCDLDIKAQLMEQLLQLILKNQDRLPLKMSHA